ncbi:MAG: YhjD/YihY/BrkB family envelope integrity protein [Pseudomonadota bacterium]
MVDTTPSAAAPNAPAEAPGTAPDTPQALAPEAPAPKPGPTPTPAASAPRPDGIRAFGWRDWWVVARGVVKEMGDNELTLIAAGVAFYGFLAIFPMLAALVAFYGFVLDPSTIQGQLDLLSEVMPPGGYAIVEGQVSQITAAGRTQLGYASLIGLALTLWTAKAGVGALIRGLNIVFKVPEKRGMVVDMAVAYGLTVALVLVGVVALATVVVLPGIIAAVPAITGVPLPASTHWLLTLARWPIMLGALVLAVGLLYRYGPAEPRPRFTWFSLGAMLAIALWIAASEGFSYYVSNFGTYNKTYGSLGAIVGLLMWLYLSALIVLLGGEINAQIEFRIFGDPTERAPAFRRKWRKIRGLRLSRKKGAGASEGANGGTNGGATGGEGAPAIAEAASGAARATAALGGIGTGQGG